MREFKAGDIVTLKRACSGNSPSQQLILKTYTGSVLGLIADNCFCENNWIPFITFKNCEIGDEVFTTEKDNVKKVLAKNGLLIALSVADVLDGKLLENHDDWVTEKEMKKLGWTFRQEGEKLKAPYNENILMNEFFSSLMGASKQTGCCGEKCVKVKD